MRTMRESASFVVPAVASLATEDVFSLPESSLYCQHSPQQTSCSPIKNCDYDEEENHKISSCSLAEDIERSDSSHVLLRSDTVQKLLLPEVRMKLDTARRSRLEELVQSTDQLSSVHYQELINMMCGKRSSSYLDAIDRKGVTMHSESRTLRPCNCCRNQKHCLCCGQMKWFSPIFITAISLVQLLVFVYCWYTVETPVVWPHRSSSSTAALSSLLYNSPLAYRSDCRAQMWRFFTYALLHNSWWHLGFNTLLQLVVGVSLECVHGSLSTGLLYTGAVLAGSLLVSVVVTSHQVALVGSSAAIYSLAAAYVTYCVQNYRRLRFAFLRLLLIVLAVACDVTMSAIRTPNSSPSSSSFTLPWASGVRVRVSLWSHLGGALSGTILGYCLLGSTTTSVEPIATPGGGIEGFTCSLVQRILRCVLLALYTCCHLAAVVYNVFLSWARVV